MAKQTDNPNFQTVCDIVIALDGLLDDLTGIKPTVEKRSQRYAEYGNGANVWTPYCYKG